MYLLVEDVKTRNLYLFTPVPVVLFLSKGRMCLAALERHFRALQSTSSRGLLGNGAYGNHCKQRALPHRGEERTKQLTLTLWLSATPSISTRLGIFKKACTNGKSMGYFFFSFSLDTMDAVLSKNKH